MRRVLVTSPALFLSIPIVLIFSGGASLGAIDSSTWLTGWNAARVEFQKDAMVLLGSWAVINIVVSGVASFRSQGRARSFHQMNGMWNAINLAIAVWGYFWSGAESALASERIGIRESLTEIHSLTRAIYLNVGLDIAYLVGGFLLREKGKGGASSRAVRWQGFGDSLLLQGGFLLLFDLWLSGKLNGFWYQIVERVGQ